jgi:predicted nucleic acid-binding protein
VTADGGAIVVADASVLVGELLRERGRAELEDGISGLVDVGAIEIVAHDAYAHLEPVARRRVPRDPNDWPTVALALLLDAAILTGDHDFLGCGCPTWTIDTLLAELAGKTK